MSTKPIKYILSLIAIITIINLIFIFLFSFFWRHLESNILLSLLYYFLASFCSAIFITFFVVASAPVLKDFLATYRQLLRLENLSHPLLMKLSLEAPGTYHHSLSVANLANRAAKAIGADPLLTRVGAYYHDIGKTTHPEYYIENQKGGSNPHDEINNPKESAKMIKEHVSEGLRLAQEYHLPKEVTSFIPEHQGTQLSNFYQKAIGENRKAKKSDFRYGGPKPLSRETAIVMLADVVEAKIRLLEKVSPEAISITVKQSIDEKIADGQLELAGLTNREINQIQSSFMDTLSVMYHQRVRYKNPIK
ncbi:MAG: hypothetical protein ACD_58C00206G0009 [uncultured bacterium]|nr:MAG: hypothetical protein ACD_58C00206G0009 [uncultured bacterium]